MNKDRIELTSENFCYLSGCKFFMSDVRSTGCKLDYMPDGAKGDLESLCPLDMERDLRVDDPNWQIENCDMAEKFREFTTNIQQDKELIDKMGPESYTEALNRCTDLSQDVEDARIEYERLQYDLQETEDRCFGTPEKKKEKK